MQTLHNLRAACYKELDAYYPDQEIESLFYIIVAETLSIPRLKAQMDMHQEVNDLLIKQFQNVLDALKKQIPIQHILGHAPFYGFDFEVNTHTLIPRPETEELVHLIIQQEKERKELRILDIGTGSGCIAISLAKFLPHSLVDGIDIATEALTVATRNAAALDAKVSFMAIDILNWRNLHFGTVCYDVIVSNPPYITPSEKLEMSAQVLDYEPHSALFVEADDPLIFYREIAAFAFQHLQSGGALYFEINQYLAIETKTIVEAQGFNAVQIVNDINSAKRMLHCLK